MDYLELFGSYHMYAHAQPVATAGAAISTALNILNKWDCSEKEKMAILGVGRSTLHKYQVSPESARLTPDLLERISYLLNIHALLRTVFENPDNIYGFVRMPNRSAFFGGKAPMEIMSSGLMTALYEVYKHLDAIRSGEFA
jgi:Protein of unknown function (DUF2384)